MNSKYALIALAALFAGCKPGTDLKIDPSSTQEATSSTEKVTPAKVSFDADESAHLTTTYYFQYDKSTLDDNSKNLLGAVADYLIENPEATVEIAGHTDLRGTKEYNQALGQRRAASVAAYLETQGVKEDQIKVLSYGKEKPLSATENDQAQALNRRVEINFN